MLKAFTFNWKDNLFFYSLEISCRRELGFVTNLNNYCSIPLLPTSWLAGLFFGLFELIGKALKACTVRYKKGTTFLCKKIAQPQAGFASGCHTQKGEITMFEHLAFPLQKL